MRPKSKLVSHPTYNPDKLLSYLTSATKSHTDIKLANTLGISPSMISRIRHRIRPVSASFLIAAHEVTGASLTELRAMMGDTDARFSGPD